MPSSPWLIRIGPLAFARTRYDAIGNWRRLWWRLWWRTVRPPKKPRPKPAAPPAPLGPMHWSPDGWPYCGASVRERWTVELDFATCPVCLEEGGIAMLRYHLNTR